MARQNISLGSSANDGTGDTLRQAGQKINETLLEIYQKFGDSDNLSNVMSFQDSGVSFSGSVFTTSLIASDVLTENITITLPDSGGIAVVDTANQTLTNKTLTTPTITSPTITNEILDTNSNELVKFTTTSSAVNEITVTNAATGNPPIISATGGDSNVNLSLVGKGSGSVQLGLISFSSIELNADGSVPATATYVICNKPTPLLVTLDSGSSVGELKFFTNKGGNTAVVTPTAFAQGSSFSLPVSTGAQCIWDGDEWYLVGRDELIII